MGRDRGGGKENLKQLGAQGGVSASLNEQSCGIHPRTFTTVFLYMYVLKTGHPCTSHSGQVPQGLV